jgi:hypothetical protein
MRCAAYSVARGIREITVYRELYLKNTFCATLAVTIRLDSNLSHCATANKKAQSRGFQPTARRCALC